MMFSTAYVGGPGVHSYKCQRHHIQSLKSLPHPLQSSFSSSIILSSKSFRILLGRILNPHPYPTITSNQNYVLELLHFFFVLLR